jgi:shikimate dehydrogenase
MAEMRKFGIIGKPIQHSWSKDYFNRKFLREGIHDCVYENFQVDNLDFIRDLVLQDKELAGLNITIPFKVEVIKRLDESDQVAGLIGAVNCVKISRAGNSVYLKGYNTDMPAFRDSLKPLLTENQKRALVLGTGGAARAVCQALKELNLEYRLVTRINKGGALTYSDINQRIITDNQIIINATPVGMHPFADDCPLLPYSCLTSFHLLYDLVYNPEMTLFLKKGLEAGARIKNGLEMLQRQAELSWEIWNG